MKYMLDTNICSYIIKHRPQEVLAKFKTLQMDDCCISSITYAELKFWVARNKRLHMKSQNQSTPKINAQIIDSFVSHLDIVEFGAHAADVYAEIRNHIEALGIAVGNADLLIGSHAISLNCILVTNNTKDFINLPNVQLENWVNN
ncbi:MAG: mvpA, tRNA [Gammaproteobacteria bacterium]|jgi:tRNA(fMet)-specific endonuclease VapC|nr:mvpA, tRNA [Gammaproteobacteria bacterium]